MSIIRKIRKFLEILKKQLQITESENQKIRKGYNSHFSYVGDNWDNNDSNQTIAVMFGFSNWKHIIYSEILKDYRTAYVRLWEYWFVTKFKLKYLPKNTKIVFISWSYNAPIEAEKYALNNGIEFIRMEDGFLRSFSMSEKKANLYHW